MQISFNPARYTVNNRYQANINRQATSFGAGIFKSTDDLLKTITKLASESDLMKRADGLDEIAIRIKNTLCQQPQNIKINFIETLLPNGNKVKITELSDIAMHSIPQGNKRAAKSYIGNIIKLESYANAQQNKNVVEILNSKGYNDIIEELQSSIFGYRKKSGNIFGYRPSELEANGQVDRLGGWSPKKSIEQ